MIQDKNKTCCFIGHRKLERTTELESALKDVIYKLIDCGFVEFIFGDHSEFNDLCYEVVTEIKKEIPYIRRIHFRTVYPDTDEYTDRLLISGYEESFFPKKIASAGRAVYVERNRAMIEASDVCVFYCRQFGCESLGSRKSGTKIAYDYAVVRKKAVINLCVENEANRGYEQMATQ